MADEPVLPTWKYSITGASRIITTAEELAALEAGHWFASPAEAADAAAKATEDESPAPRPSRR